MFTLPSWHIVILSVDMRPKRDSLYFSVVFGTVVRTSISAVVIWSPGRSSTKYNEEEESCLLWQGEGYFGCLWLAGSGAVPLRGRGCALPVSTTTRRPTPSGRGRVELLFLYSQKRLRPSTRLTTLHDDTAMASRDPFGTPEPAAAAGASVTTFPAYRDHMNSNPDLQDYFDDSGIPVCKARAPSRLPV